MKNRQFVSSWSGGKDSAMAFYRAVQAGAVPKRLWTMFETDEKRSKSHALPLEILEAQADSIGVPLMIRGADWNHYEAQFLDAMKECVEAGIGNGVFGDIDLEDHLTWVQNACAKVGMKALHPLWQEPRRKILDELIDVGFEAYIVVGHDDRLPQHYVGQRFTKELMDELEALGIDSCGEEGEFHTLVVDGPIFQKRIPVNFGKTIHRDGYTFLNMHLKIEVSDSEST